MKPKVVNLSAIRLKGILRELSWFADGCESREVFTSVMVAINELTLAVRAMEGKK